MEDKNSYQRKMEDRINEWSLRIDEFLGKAEKKAKAGYENASVDLEEKRCVAAKRLQELRASSGEAWQDLKPGLENAWRELKDAFEKAASRF